MIKTVYVFLAHPDDTDNYCPNFLKYLVDAGKNVHLYSFTRGEHGIGASTDPIKEEFRGSRLGKMRSIELKNAAKIIGIPGKHVHFLEIEDSKVRILRKEAYCKIMAVLHQRLPDLVLAPEFYLGYYKHPDHVYAGMITFIALKHMNYKGKIMFYHTIKGKYYHPARKELSDAVIAEHKTQKEFFKFLYPLYSKIEQIVNGFHVQGSLRAERYRISSVAETQAPDIASRLLGLFFPKPRTKD